MKHTRTILYSRGPLLPFFTDTLFFRVLTFPLHLPHRFTFCRFRFCVGDRFYLSDNKVLCEADYNEKIAYENGPINCYENSMMVSGRAKEEGKYSGGRGCDFETRDLSGVWPSSPSSASSLHFVFQPALAEESPFSAACDDVAGLNL